MGDGDDGGPSVGDFGGGPDGGITGDAGFGGPSPGNMGDAGSMSDAGLGFGFGDMGFSDSALASMPNVTDLSTALNDFGMEGIEGLSSFSDALGSVPSFSMSNQTSFLQDLAKSKTFQAIMGLLAAKGVPVAQAFTSMPAKAAMSSNPAGTMGKGAIGMGMSAMGPIGTAAFMGLDALGAFNGIANALGNTNAPASFQGNDADMGIGNALPGLAGMFAGYQGMRETDKMLGGLQGLYGQNSPYAQMLRQQLQRKDAAGGRRSQYGPREVELQAKLAQMASGQIGAMSQLQQRQNINRAQMMQQGLGAFQKLGGMNALQQLFGMGGRGGMYDTSATQALGSLGNIFGNNGMDSFGPLPEGLGYNFDLGLPGG